MGCRLYGTMMTCIAWAYYYCRKIQTTSVNGAKVNSKLHIYYHASFGFSESVGSNLALALSLWSILHLP